MHHPSRALAPRTKLAAIGIAVVAVAAGFVTHPADARPGGRNSSSCSTGQTICIAASANDGSVCSRIRWGVDWAWQCTPVLVSTAVPAQPVAETGGSASWSGSATCDWRKKGDGINPNWGPWRSCSMHSRSGSGSSSWDALSNPRGGSVQMDGPQIVNVDTWGMTDCVEIRTSVRTSASARSTVAGVTVESTSTSVRFPSGGTNVTGICEGGSPY